jgi:hypothetical protein
MGQLIAWIYVLLGQEYCVMGIWVAFEGLIAVFFSDETVAVSFESARPVYLASLIA